MNAENKRKLTLALLLFAGMCFSLRVLHAQPVNIEAAKKEGRVVVYGAVPPQSMDGIHKPFEKKYGIRVEYWRAAPNKVMDRALTEWRAGRPGFDVVEGPRAVELIMRDQGLFTKYIPPSAEKLPPQFMEKDGLITPWRAVPIGILYNTELVKGADIPRSFQDLLNPKWKKKLSMSDPTQHTSSAAFLQNLEKIMGPQWLEFARGLAKQEPHLVESYAPVTNALIRGEAHVGITLVKYVKQFKGPMDYAMLDKFLTDANYISLSAKAPNPNAGRLYIEYAISPEGQKAIAADGEFALYPGVNPDIRDAGKVISRAIFLDPPTEEEFKKLRLEFRKIFFGQ